MKGFTRTVIAGALLAAGAQAAADVSYNAGITTDYRFRGVSQSAQDPAVQGGVDYSHKNGLYLGAWASTIDFGTTDPDADLEIDLYGGYKWKAANIDWDVGLIHYAYPGSTGANDWDFTELYIGGTYGPVNVKYYYADNFTGPGSLSAYYLTAGASFDVGSGYTLAVSAGKSDGDAFVTGFVDYKIGVSKEFAGFGFNLSYVDTDIDPAITSDEFNSEGKLVLTVTKTF